MSRRLIIFFILFISALLLVELVPRVRGLSSPFLGLSAKIEGTLYHGVQQIHRPLTKLVLGQDVSTKLDSLEEQIKTLSFDRSRLDFLEDENRSLKKLVDFSTESYVKKITTRVIGHDPREPQTLLRLGRGSSGGIKQGDAVVDPAGVLMGVISEVSAKTSTVRLLHSPSLTIPVRVPVEEYTFGLLASPDGLSLHINQVPKDRTLKPGSLVVTNTGLKGVPPNVPIGSVGTILSQPESLWQEAIVVPFVDFKTVSIVAVLTDLGEETNYETENISP